MLIYSHIVHMQIRGHSLHAFLKIFLLLTCGHITHMQIHEISLQSTCILRVVLDVDL